MTPIAMRQDGLSLLLGVATSANLSAGKVVLISGEAGIGKSRMIDEFLAKLPAAQPRAKAACDGLSGARHFGPLLDMSENLGEKFARELSDAIGGRDPVGGIGQAVCHCPPGTVLVFEDIHNADKPTLDVLTYLLHRTGSAQTLLVFTYRPEEIDLNHPLVEMLSECPAEHTKQFELPGLTRAETAAMCDFECDRVDFIHRLGGGNPLFVTELLRKNYKNDSDLPAAIKRFAAARLHKFSESGRRWIELMAAASGPQSPSQLERLSREFELPLADIPFAGGLLTTRAGVEFRHEVVRRAVLAQLSDFARIELQSRLLALFEQWGEEARNPEAYFKLALECLEPAAIVASAIPAAKAAEERGDLFECVHYLEQALPFALKADPALHGQMVEIWACRAAVIQGITEKTINTVANSVVEWDRLEVPKAAATSRLLLARLLKHQAEANSAGPYLEQAIADLERFGASIELVMAHALASETALDRYDLATAKRHHRRMRQAVRATDGDSASRLELMLLSARLLAADGKQEQASRRLEAIYRTAEEMSLHETAARIQIVGCDIALDNFELDRAELWAVRDSTLLSSAGVNCWKTALIGRQALIAGHRGKIDQAAAYASKAMTGTAAPAAYSFPAKLAKAIVLARQAAPGALEALEECIDLGRRLGNRSFEDAAKINRIKYLYLAGRREEARQWCEALLADLSEYAESPSACLCKLWLHRLGLDDSAIDPVLPQAIALEISGDFAEAAQQWQDSGYLLEAAIAKISDTSIEAKAKLAQVHKELQEMDATAAIGFVRRIAGNLGIALPKNSRKRGPYHAARANVLGLTRREVDILKMILAGVNNREISARLNRSLRTIEHHVSSILGKMGVESRVQAAIYAISHPGIVDSAGRDI